MPPSPKLYRPRQAAAQPEATRRSAAMVACIVFGLGGFIFGIFAIYRENSAYYCKYAKPESVSVIWERDGSISNGGNGFSDMKEKRYKVMGFVGIQTGFASFGRRKSLRKTWFPSDHRGLRRLEEATGLVFRFVIGRTTDQYKMSLLRKEIAEYDDFLLLDIQEEYRKLPYKTLAFFKAAYALYDSDFYVKADDDIYLRPDRLSLLLAKERSHSQTYIGCMKRGPVFTNPKLKWYESQSNLLGKEYFLHAYGPIYALSADVVASLGALRNDSFRMFSNEDVTIGAWMVAMNVNHENSRLLCAPKCTTTSIAVWDIPKCSGLCGPEKKLLELHAMEICLKSPTEPPEDY